MYKIDILFLLILQLLHCITKLYNLPVTVEHLQDTGIGKTVNSLRKFDGEVGVTAKALVTKWKAMVAAAESSENDEDDEEDNGKSEGKLFADLIFFKAFNKLNVF